LPDLPTNSILIDTILIKALKAKQYIPLENQNRRMIERLLTVWEGLLWATERVSQIISFWNQYWQLFSSSMMLQKN